MKKAYLVYRTVAGDKPGKEYFLYLKEIENFRFVYTEKIGRAKRFTLFQAMLLSVLRMSFVAERVVKIYN